MLALEGFCLGLEGLNPVIAFLRGVGTEDEAGMLALGGGFVALSDLDGLDDRAPAAVAVEDYLRGGGAFDCLKGGGRTGRKGGEEDRDRYKLMVER